MLFIWILSWHSCWFENFILPRGSDTSEIDYFLSPWSVVGEMFGMNSMHSRIFLESFFGRPFWGNLSDIGHTTVNGASLDREFGKRLNKIVQFYQNSVCALQLLFGWYCLYLWGFSVNRLFKISKSSYISHPSKYLEFETLKDNVNSEFVPDFFDWKKTGAVCESYEFRWFNVELRVIFQV